MNSAAAICLVGVIACLGAAEVRPPVEGRPRHRSEEQDQRGSRRGHRERQGRGRRGEHRSGRGAQGGRRVGLLRHAGARRHSRPRLRRNGRARILRRRQQPVSRRLHAAIGRDHGRRRRIVGLAELRGLQAAHHRSVQDARAGAAQHRRPRDARRQVRAGPGRHGSQADGRHGASPQGCDRRHQDRALCRPGMGAGRARGRGGHAGEHSGHGGLWHQSPGASDGGARDQEAAARRHLHARLFRASQRAGRRPAA